MTPKEKAEQLIQRFYFSLPNNGSQTGINNVNNRWEEGKKCALIAVDEIISEIEPSVSMDVISARIDYWNEVKQEIEKL